MWALRPDCVVDRPGRSMSGGEKLTARPLHLNDKVGQPSRESESADRAMVCGPAPVGQARWSVRLIATEAVRRKLVPQVGRETIRMLLGNPTTARWSVSRAPGRCAEGLRQASAGVASDDLNGRKAGGPARAHAAPQPMRAGDVARRDYEYKRCGTANVFVP